MTYLKYKIAYYTCNIGNYDNPIFDGRKFINVNLDLSNRYKAKFVKTHPHFFFPLVDYWVWIDSNLELKVSLKELVNLLGDKPVLVHKHTHRDTVNQEIKVCLEMNLDSETNLKYHKDRDGLLGETGLLVIQNSPETRYLLEQWWIEILRGSHRDQVSFPYTLGKAAKYINESIYNSPYIKYNNHR